MSEADRSWARLETHARFTQDSLAELIDGGQAFRWNQQASRAWRGQWSDHVVELSFAEPNTLRWRSLTTNSGTDENALRRYLSLDDEHHDLHQDILPWRSDSHLRKCMTAFPGLRILRQPFGETLLGFLCSATKQIVQIKQMIALLAQKHGSPLNHHCHVIRDNDSDIIDFDMFTLPNWAQLAELSEEQLRACQLGFRARYIKGTADYIRARPGWLEQTAQLPYPAARAALCELPGVGEKIADCVALFGLGHLQAFPVDTWMIKSMARRYGLDGWTPTQVAHFGRVHFGPSAGLAQQYLFAWERAHGRK